MGSSNSFKSYAREGRQQLTEEMFGMGMRWTQAPLPEGFSKLLVNYDVKDAGNMLVPRTGLRPTRLGIYPEDYTTTKDSPNWTDTQAVVASKACAESDGDFAQIILGDTGALVADATTGLIKGASIALTCPEADTDWDDIPVSHMKTAALDASPGHCLFRTISTKGIHKLPREAGPAAITQVGTFAYGNQFFYFRKGASGYELCTTKYDELTGKYTPEVVAPKDITPKEAVLWGYNMLDSSPYTFNNSATAGNIQLLGILPYDANDNLQLSPVVNQTLKLVCNYAAAAGTTHKLVWEWKDVSGTAWNLLKEDAALDTGALTAATCTFSSPVGAAMVRVTAYASTAPTVIAQVLAVGFNFSKSALGSTANIAPKTYTLASCQGMTYWKNQLVVWSPIEDRTVMFMSDINAPHYFPYPNKAEVFEEPVIHAMPLLDGLLVFTSTSLVQLTLAGDGLSWTKKTIQRNLEIDPEDIHLIQAVRNMVFFKSGNYYYMVVPSTKSLGDLVVAPISGNLVSMFDNFSDAVSEILMRTYDYDDGFTLLHYYNFLDFEDVHNIYMLRTVTGTILNLDLCYNTLTRGWRIYLFESPSQIRAHKQDVTTRGTYVALTKIIQPYTLDTVPATAAQPAIQFLGFHASLVPDLYIPNDSVYPDDVIENVYESERLFQNWQVWDTGYREHNTNQKKRYREIQFKLNNTSQQSLNFSTDFYIDGEQRKDLYQYSVEHIVDEEDSNYGLIYVTRTLIDPLITPGTTVLAEDAENAPGWTLDESFFPEMTLWKVRDAVSGKGYTPRYVLISRNEESYEILSISWVFRMMYSR